MKINLTEPQTLSYDASKYSSFPDIIKLPSCYLAVFREGDEHHPKKSTLVLMKSEDGKSWTRKDFATASLDEEGYVFNCPRLSIIENRVILSCDIKSSQKEGKADWSILLWWSKNSGDSWTSAYDTKISGMVPDKIIVAKNKLIMGYHIIESTPLTDDTTVPPSRLVQMMAESYDGGIKWRDRTTVACSNKHDFCEGSIIKLNESDLICYLRDNRGPKLRAYFTTSKDLGKTWSSPAQTNFTGHRVVAGIKKIQPYAGLIVGTFRNTINKTVSMFLQNSIRDKMQVFTLDSESDNSIFNYGYTGWCENQDGSIKVINYIKRNKPNPEIYTMDVELL